MSQPRFTPGPWVVADEPNDNDGTPETVIAAAGGFPAVALDFGPEYPEIREANARLIASAPTLLEALTLAASKPLAEHCTDEEWAFIRGAIMGAQGEQP